MLDLDCNNSEGALCLLCVLPFELDRDTLFPKRKEEEEQEIFYFRFFLGEKTKKVTKNENSSLENTT